MCLQATLCNKVQGLRHNIPCLYDTPTAEVKEANAVANRKKKLLHVGFSRIQAPWIGLGLCTHDWKF